MHSWVSVFPSNLYGNDPSLVSICEGSFGVLPMSMFLGVISLHMDLYEW